MEISILLGIIFIVIYNVLDYLSNRFLSSDFLSTFGVILVFFFIYANIDPIVAPFYLIMGMIVLLFTMGRSAIQQIQVKNSSTLSFQAPIDNSRITFSGPIFYLVNVLLGIGTFFVMWGSLNTSDVNKLQAFFGVPLLSIAAIKSAFAPITVISLAILENKFVIIVYEFLKLLKDVLVSAFSALFTGLISLIPFLSFILGPLIALIGVFMVTIGPVVLAALFFAVLHILVYNLVFQALLFAFAIMTFWLIIYIVTGNDIAMNNGHMIWNLFIHYLRTKG